MSPFESHWPRGGAAHGSPSPLTLYLSRLCPEASSYLEKAHGAPWIYLGSTIPFVVLSHFFPLCLTPGETSFLLFEKGIFLQG